jgi:hypothetical protein
VRSHWEKVWKDLCSLWPHCLKYLLSGRSMMTPFIPLLTVTSLTEVFIEWMEYDDTFHTSAHCDLTVWSIYWRGEVRWHLSHLRSQWAEVWKVSSYSIPSINTSYSGVTVGRGMKGVIVLHSEYDDTFHTSAHCDLTVWSIYSVDGVWWHLSYLCSLWPSEVTMSRGMKGVIILLPLNKYFIQWGHIEKKYERLHRTPSTQ